MILQEDRNGHNQQLGDKEDWTLPTRKESQSTKIACESSGPKTRNLGRQASHKKSGLRSGSGSQVDKERQSRIGPGTREQFVS